MIRVLLLLSIVCISTAFAQGYHPFPASDAMWRVQWGSSGCAFSDQYADYQYLITGDTVIGGTNYHKLHRSGVFNCQPPLMPVTGYMGAFRNDTDARMVHFIPAGMVTEQVLYDFNLDVGDAITGYLTDPMNTGDPNLAIITSIDSILIGDSYRKRWNFSSTGIYWPGSFIEGIGGDAGPLEALMARFDDNGGLLCFSYEYEVLYLTSGTCELVTSIMNHRELVPHIFPDPAIEWIEIRTNDHLQGIYLFDQHGRLVKSFSINERDQTMLLSIADLSPAIYTVFIRGSSGNGRARFLKL